MKAVFVALAWTVSELLRKTTFGTEEWGAKQYLCLWAVAAASCFLLGFGPVVLAAIAIAAVAILQQEVIERGMSPAGRDDLLLRLANYAYLTVVMVVPVACVCAASLSLEIVLGVYTPIVLFHPLVNDLVGFLLGVCFAGGLSKSLLKCVTDRLGYTVVW